MKKDGWTVMHALVFLATLTDEQTRMFLALVHGPEFNPKELPKTLWGVRTLERFALQTPKKQKVLLGVRIRAHNFISLMSYSNQLCHTSSCHH